MEIQDTHQDRASAQIVAGTPRAGTQEEIELKFLVPPGEMEQIRTAPVIARHARNVGFTRQLEAVYYDTPDRTLFTHGLSLRVRRNGDRCVQTLTRAPLHGQSFARGEWEAAVDGMAPDLALMPTAEISAPLDRLSADALHPIFMTKVYRRTQQLELSGTVIEVAFDEGSIEAGEHCEPLIEIELWMKSGDPRVLYDLGIGLLEVAPLRVGTQSKADRGYGLAFSLAPTASKAKPPAITVEHTVDDIVGVLLETCQHHLVANQPIAECGREPEGIHQMRVALRRLRTICMLLRRELGLPTLMSFSTEAKWLAQQLGAARNWDVFITETLSEPAEVLQSDSVNFHALREAAEPHRLAAYATVQETLASQRYNRFQLLLRRWIEMRGWRNELPGGSLALLLEPAAEFAGRTMMRLHRKALKSGSHFRRLDPAARHQLRIALKKLRYTTELFNGVHNGSNNAKDYRICLSRLQDMLGHDNDAAMTQPFLRTLSLECATPEVHRTIGVVMGWQARDRIAGRSSLHWHWQRFKAIQPFWSN
jgi:inorganic triphosphatase YgiF